jgi:hypothetical protein
LLGELVKYKGVTVALINIDGYSVTTSKHIRSAQHATEHIPTISTTSNQWSVTKGLRRERDRLLAEMEAHFRRRRFWNQNWNSKDYGYGLRSDIEKFNTVCSQLRETKYRIKVTKEYIGRYNAHIRKCIKRREQLNRPEEIAKRIARREKANATKLNRELQNWRLGGSLTSTVRNCNPQLLRIRGEVVETSRGARVPLTDAREFLRRLQAGQVSAGDRIGPFEFSSIEGNTVRIGCHTLDLAEIRNVLLGNPNLQLVVG